jgi:CRP-like cAMP-binding protein
MFLPATTAAALREYDWPNQWPAEEVVWETSMLIDALQRPDNVEPVKDPAYNNVLLRRLDCESIARLDLQRVELPVDREIEYPGKRIGHLFFIEEGMASMTATFEDGFQVEVALAGSESVLGTSSMMGTHRSLNRVYMQMGGWGYSSAMAAATKEFKRSETFHDLTLRYLQAQFIQSAQTAGCNAHHSIEQRMARWLLLCSDRVGDRVLPLSHEYMAIMLGVTRSSVTVVAGRLQELGLIQYTRGKIQLLDHDGLEAMSCECYRVVRDHLHSLSDRNEDFGT